MAQSPTIRKPRTVESKNRFYYFKVALSQDRKEPATILLFMQHVLVFISSFHYSSMEFLLLATVHKLELPKDSKLPSPQTQTNKWVHSIQKLNSKPQLANKLIQTIVISQSQNTHFKVNCPANYVNPKGFRRKVNCSLKSNLLGPFLLHQQKHITSTLWRNPTPKLSP